MVCHFFSFSVLGLMYRLMMWRVGMPFLGEMVRGWSLSESRISWAVTGALGSMLSPSASETVLVMVSRTSFFFASFHRVMMSCQRCVRSSSLRAWRWSNDPRYEGYVTSKGSIMSLAILVAIHFCIMSFLATSSVVPQLRNEKRCPFTWPWGTFGLGVRF